MSTSSKFSDNEDASNSFKGFRSEEFDWLRKECETLDPEAIEREAERRVEHPLGRRFKK